MKLVLIQSHEMPPKVLLVDDRARRMDMVKVQRNELLSQLRLQHRDTRRYSSEAWRDSCSHQDKYQVPALAYNAAQGARRCSLALRLQFCGKSGCDVCSPKSKARSIVVELEAGYIKEIVVYNHRLHFEVWRGIAVGRDGVAAR